MLCAARPSGWGGTLRKLPRGCSLEGRSHVVQFGGLLQRRYADDRALVRDRGDQAVRRELTNRLPDRRAGNADALGQLTLDQALDGTQARLHDLLAQNLKHLSAQRRIDTLDAARTRPERSDTLPLSDHFVIQPGDLCMLAEYTEPPGASQCALLLPQPPLDTTWCAGVYNDVHANSRTARAIRGAE
jgi:hypothetical protein